MSDAGAPGSPASPAGARRERLLALALLVLAALLVGRYVRAAWKGNDFGAYHAAARSVLEGGDLYAAQASGTPGAPERPYLYPPFLAVALAPLGALPEGPAGAVWVLGLLAALVASLVALTSVLVPGPARERWRVAILACAMLFGVLDNDLKNGQVNVLLMAILVTGAWWASRARWGWAGAALAVATSIKVTPGLFLVYLAWTRRWRALLGFAAGAAVASALLPAVVLGPARALEASRRWVAMMVDPVVEGRDYEVIGPAWAPPYQQGQSLRPVVYRWTTPSRYTREPQDARVNLLDLPLGTAEWIYRGLALLLLAATLHAVGRPRGPRPAAQLLAEFALLATTMAAIAPVSRRAHFAVLLPAAVWFVARAVSPGRRRERLIALAVAALVCTPDLLHGLGLKDVVRNTGSTLVAALLLWFPLRAGVRAGACAPAGAA